VEEPLPVFVRLPALELLVAPLPDVAPLELPALELAPLELPVWLPELLD
jgi:hypothetical protein